MNEQQKNKMDKKILHLSLGLLAVAVVFLIICGVKNLTETLIFPIGICILLLAYWFVSDVLSVFWVKEFEGKTDAQKKAYYIFAAMDAASLAGLAYFIIDIDSMAGVLVYVLFNMSKRRYKDEFLGIVPSEETEPETAQTENTGINSETAEMEHTELEPETAGTGYTESELK